MKSKRRHFVIGIAIIFSTLVRHLSAENIVQGSVQGKEDDRQGVSFKENVFPVLQKYCLPCHAEESDNSSELSLDSYRLLMEGGKHGPAVKRGNPEESPLIQKLSDKPPFGDRMPITRRRTQQPPKRLTEEEVRILSDWIRQGAREN